MISPVNVQNYYLALDHFIYKSAALVDVYKSLLVDPSARATPRVLVCHIDRISSYLDNSAADYFEEWCFFLETDGASDHYFVIHKDGDAQACLLIPLLNCTEDTTTTFYEEFYPVRTKYREQVQQLLNPDSVEPVLTATFGSSDFGAYLLNCGKWHSVHNGSKATEKRIVVSWRAKPEFTWEEIGQAIKSNSLK